MSVLKLDEDNNMMISTLSKDEISFNWNSKRYMPMTKLVMHKRTIDMPRDPARFPKNIIRTIKTAAVEAYMTNRGVGDIQIDG